MGDPTALPLTTLSPSSPIAPCRNATKLQLQDKDYNFTPGVSKNVPRAWERKPATPFAPRTESHKIWKRCDRSNGLQGFLWEKISNGDKEHERCRSVKRMRINNALGGKENREQEFDTAFVGTKYEDLGEIEEKRHRKVAVDACPENRIAAANKIKIKSVTSSLEENWTFTPMSEIAEGDREAERSVAQVDGAADDNTRSTYHSRRTTRLIASVGFGGIYSSSRIDANVGSNARSVSTNETGTKKTTPEPAVDETKTKKKRRVQKMEQPRQAKDEWNPIETPGLIIAHEKVHLPTQDSEAAGPKASIVAESDDTEYLHAFLTRAKAKKAARAIASPEKQASGERPNYTASSPQTRSRTALATLDGNSFSPTKTTKLEMPARKLQQDSSDSPDTKTTSPLRKSSRHRLPRPHHHQPTTPSSIPFRRSNGTEFVFLQKTEAQQIAIATRSNTRRNKGEALQPKMKLEALSSQPQSSPSKVGTKRINCKQVSWDERLAYFASKGVQPEGEVKEEVAAKTPVKRSRRLAAGKGTPAPKKQMAEAAVHPEARLATPLTKTRTRTKSKTLN
jgi:hypothetical protein